MATIAEILCCTLENCPWFFLGMNIGINHKQTSSCSNLIERLKRRLAKWKDKNLLFGGRITLAQAVLSVVSIYSLFFCLIQKKFIKEITRIQRNFLWGGCENQKKKILWVIWNVNCKEKKRGLGIHNLKFFNYALLGK